MACPTINLKVGDLARQLWAIIVYLSDELTERFDIQYSHTSVGAKSLLIENNFVISYHS